MLLSDVLVVLGFVDLVSVSVSITYLSSHIGNFDVSPTWIGVFASIYGGVQLVSSYCMGYMSDRFSRLNVLIMCCLVTSLGYFIMASSPSFGWLILSRIIAGVFKHSQTLSKAIISVNEGKSAQKKMGYFSSLSSMGMIIGPPIGGLLYDRYGFYTCGCVSSAGFFIMSLVLITVKPYDAEGEHSTDRRDSLNRKRLSKRILFQQLGDTYIIQFLSAFAVIIYRTNYSFTLRERFQVTATTTGLATSYSAVIGSLTGLLIGFFSSLYCGLEWRLLLRLSILQTLSMLFCGLVTSFPLYLVAMTPISFSNMLARDCFLTIWLQRVDRAYIGQVFGLSGSLLSLARLIAPTLGGIMQDHISLTAPTLAGSAITTLVVVAILYLPRVVRPAPLPLLETVETEVDPSSSHEHAD